MRSEIEAYYEANYGRLVKKFSYRAGGIPNAEDVVQEAFARALQYMSSFDSTRQELGAWFNTILNNALKDAKRDHRKQGMTPGVDEDAELSEPLDATMMKEQMIANILADIEKRAPVHQQVLTLYFLQGYTAKDISRVVDQKLNTVQTYIKRFKQHMRDAYGESMCS